MATQRQIAANRRNALKSTGPRSQEGKAHSRMNALRHGASSKVMADENFVNRYSNDAIAGKIQELDRNRLDLFAALQDAIASNRKMAVKSLLRKLSSLERLEKAIVRLHPATS